MTKGYGMYNKDSLPVRAGRDLNGKIQMFCSFEGCTHKVDEGYCTQKDIRVDLAKGRCKTYEASTKH